MVILTLLSYHYHIELYFSYTLEAECMCAMTGTWHAMGKQPIIGDLNYVILNGPKDSHLLYLLVSHSIS